MSPPFSLVTTASLSLLGVNVAANWPLPSLLRSDARGMICSNIIRDAFGIDIAVIRSGGRRGSDLCECFNQDFDIRGREDTTDAQVVQVGEGLRIRLCSSSVLGTVHDHRRWRPALDQ